MDTKQLLMASILAAGSIVGVIPKGSVSATTYTVTTTAAAGAGSLAEAIADANANAGPDEITFDPAVTGVIDIGATTLTSTDALTITGPGSDVLALTNTGAAPIVDSSSGAFAMTGLTLSNGDNGALNVTAPGADVTLTDVVVDTMTDLGIVIVNADNVGFTDVEISDAPVGLQIDNVGSVDFSGVSISDTDTVGVIISNVTGDVTMVGLDLTSVLSTVLQVTMVGGTVTLDQATFADSNGGVVIDDAAAATITNVDAAGLAPTSVVGLTNVPGAVTMSNVDLGASLQLGGLGTLDIDDLDVDVPFGAAGIVLISGTTGPVTIDDSAFRTVQLGSVLSINTLDSSLSITNSTIDLQTQVIGTVAGDVSLSNIASTSLLGGLRIEQIGGNVTIDTSSTNQISLDDIAGSTELTDHVIEENAGLPAPGITASDLDDLTLDRVTTRDGYVQIEAMKAATVIEISDSTFGSRIAPSLTVADSATTDFVIDGSTIAGPAQGLALSTLQSATITNTTISRIGLTPLAITDATTEIINSTISDNSFGVGFALTTNSAVTIHNSVIADNGGADFDVTGPGSITAQSSILTPDGDTVIAGSNNQRIDDPQLGELADNSGPTLTMLPRIGSPAIDAGDDNLAGTPSVDQRGGAREPGALDIGAVEVDNGSISVSDVTVDETAGVAQITLTRTGPGDADATVDVATVDGTATAGTDYTATSSTVTFPSGDPSPQTFAVPILADSLLEGDETFTVSVTNPTTSDGSSLLSISIASATVTITDVPPGPAITSLAPARFVDTRPGTATTDGRYQGVGKRGADTELEVIIAGRGGVPADARGVVMNITAIGAEGVGFVTAHSCVSPRPNASSLNVTAGVNLGNEVVAGLSSDGSICLYTSGAAHLTVDVVGYVGVDSPTSPLTPARILDTRSTGETIDGDFEGDGKTTAGGQIDLDVTGRGGVPAGAQAAILNVTAIGATSNGFVTVHPCVSPVPTASSLNFVAGVNRGNELIVSLDSAGQSCLSTSAAIHLTADVVGYIPAGTNFSPVAPGRLLDTRPGQSTVDGDHAAVGRLEAGDQYELAVAGRGGVPADADAVVVNLTAIGASGNGFITLHPCVNPRPNASSLNYIGGVNGGNEVVAQLDASGKICVYTSAGAHVTVDVVGALVSQ